MTLSLEYLVTRERGHMGKRSARTSTRVASASTAGVFESAARAAFVAVAAALLIVAAVLLCSCAAQTSNAQSTSTDTRPKLVVGSDSYTPYNYLNESGNPTGIDVEMLTEAFDRLGYQLEFKYINWEDKDNLLESGEIDMVAGCFSMTGRESKYTWAGPYSKSRQVVAVNPSSNIYSLADLEDKVIAVQSTTKPESIILEGTNQNVGQIYSLYSLEDRTLLYPMLSEGYVDAIAAHETAIKQSMKDYGSSYRILDESLLDVELGVAFSRNNTTDIPKQLDQELAAMIEDGTLERIMGNYVDNPESYLSGVNPLER